MQQRKKNAKIKYLANLDDISESIESTRWKYCVIKCTSNFALDSGTTQNENLSAK